MGKITYGYINTVNKTSGTVTVMQPEQGRNITGEIPFFSHCGEYKMPEAGEPVAVIFWGSNSSDGVALGSWWSKGNPPPAEYEFYKDTGSGSCIFQKDGKLSMKDTGGEISVEEIIKKLDDHEKRISGLGG